MSELMSDREYEAEWRLYASQMRRYRAGELYARPRVPFQRGRHIDSMPSELRPPPIKFQIVVARIDTQRVIRVCFQKGVAL